MFSRPTYIVLDLPDAVSREIQQIRKDLDPERANLNAEISLIGSSGVGVISPGQPFRRVFNEVDRVAAEFEPFTTGFIGVDCFAGTGICFFVWIILKFLIIFIGGLARLIFIMNRCVSHISLIAL